MNLKLLAILSGLFFGVWPLFMNKSGLNGNVASAAFCTMVLIGVLPLALYSSGGNWPSPNWTMLVSAGFFSLLGLVCFNGMLAKATIQNIGPLLVLSLVCQAIVAAGYQIFVTRSLPLDKGAGYAFASVAVYLLLR